MRYIILHTITLIFSSSIIFSQTPNSLASIETMLAEEYENILNEDLFERSDEALKFYSSFCDILENDKSFEYPFSQLKNIGAIYSPDGRLRIYTWNIPLGYNDNLYFGILQYYSKHDKKYCIIRLNDEVNMGESKLKIPWNEALYYAIIETKHASQKYYTLLGFHFNSPLSNMKIVDVLSIDDFDEAYFCKNLFFYDQKRMDRITFEYNEKAIMSLKYNSDNKMIVFDHLSSSKPSLEGKYEFYGPDFTYDGLKWEKGVWRHYSNIDVTN